MSRLDDQEFKHEGLAAFPTSSNAGADQVMEIDIDDVTWMEIVTHPPVIENGDLVLPAAPRSTRSSLSRGNPPGGPDR